MPKLSAAAARVRAVYEERWGAEICDEDAEALAQAALAKPSKDPTLLQEMTQAIIELCGWTTAMWGRATASAKKILAQGKTVAELILHYGLTDPGSDVWWWYRDGDFRKKDGLWGEWIVDSLAKWDNRAVPVVTQSRRDQQRVAERGSLLNELRTLQMQEAGCGD